MNKTKIFALVLVLAMMISVLASCGEPAVQYQDIDLNDVVERTDYTSVYEMIGSDVTIDMVDVNEDGLAFVTVDGVTYELGMDFLSMAMVYNTQPAGDFTTEEAVYNEWYKLYIVRWNYLVAEVPLYANEYYDLYNAKIENFVTSPYWAVADAIVAANVKAGQANSVILGSATDLSGAFRNSSWGKSSPGSSDLDVQNLTTGYSTLITDMSGNYVNNMTALANAPVVTENQDGSKTYTITINEGLKFSDGSAITAKNYIAGVLANSTAVAVAAGGTGAGVITGCQENGIYAIGVDADQSYLAPETVITSAMKRVDIAAQDISKAVKEGTFKGGVVMYDITNGGVDIAPTQDLLTDDMKAAVETAKQGLIDGSIVVSTTSADCPMFELQ